MRIVIDVEGDKVTLGGPDTASASAAASPYGDPLPGAAPPELLARAKKLGAKSAGPAQFGRGAALATSAVLDAELVPSRGGRKRAPATARKRKSSSRKKRRR